MHLSPSADLQAQGEEGWPGEGCRALLSRSVQMVSFPRLPVALPLCPDCCLRLSLGSGRLEGWSPGACHTAPCWVPASLVVGGGAGWATPGEPNQGIQSPATEPPDLMLLSTQHLQAEGLSPLRRGPNVLWP